MAYDGVFEVKEEIKLDDIKQLINQPYTYANIIKNPILKPIAECDKSLMDIDEMLYKKLIDINKLKELLNVIIDDIPAYQDSSFVADLIRLLQSMDDVIKLQDIKFANTTDCIKKVVELTSEHYGLKDTATGNYVKPVIVIPEGSVISYLDKLIAKDTGNVHLVASTLKEMYLKTSEDIDEKQRLEDVAYEYYGKELDKAKRKIASEINRMKL